MPTDVAKNKHKRRGRPSRLDDPTYVAMVRALYPTHQTTYIATLLEVRLRTLQDHVRVLGLTGEEAHSANEKDQLPAKNAGPTPTRRPDTRSKQSVPPPQQQPRRQISEHE